MKKITLLFLLVSSFAFSQTAGDILFVGFNADGDKDFAVVAMTDLPANTIIYFTDSEPNAAGNGNSDAEGILKWDTGASIVNAGTVVTFTDVDSVSNANFGASVGTLTYPDSGFNIAAGGDWVYATYGDPGSNSVTTWIAGIQNNDDPTETNFSATGLSTATNYVILDDTASKDGGYYSGAITGKTASEYAALIVNDANWTTSTSDGESLLPFPTTAFSFETLSNDELVSSEKVTVSVTSGKMVSSQGTVVKLLNVLGQEIANENLASGIYLVLVQVDNKLETFKIAL